MIAPDTPKQISPTRDPVVAATTGGPVPTLPERLADLAGSAFLHAAEVTVAEPCAPGFIRVELRSDAFRDAAWTPGTKVQIRTRRGTLKLRTYTPTRWDADTTELIAYTHGDGPATDWFRGAAAGATCDVLGPRKSIDLRGLDRAVFIGDESSIALAIALSGVTSRVDHVFEASDPDAVTAMLASRGLAESSVVVPKTADPQQLLTRARAAAPTEPFDLVVTGDAKTVHQVRRDSRDWPNRPGQTKGKAYWAEGRAGLD
ncbi:siderophore-interacting protein [Umezawaea sp. Da 62-37]|uniref:siderophore-interacting protein n=1 Tax=Umezawaea sp. Da 62-37 TaxID=3075927 RepID=UPI0028F707D1|nr:siderophore-interacting protein [Umezawaea sp. Da 62-37]WNV88009.1 siderophore-interacting protein [Umezawaea sp. Da 62-37]